MKVREAKDFLVQQVTEQASLEGIPLSDLEKRMMYFTEGKDAVEDPATLNDEFEAQYDSLKYEKKISRLMRQAYKRLKKEKPESALMWDKAIRTLRQGDHYMLVMWGHPLSHSSLRDWLVFVAIGLPIAIVMVAAFFLFPRRNGTWPYSNYIPLPNPHVMQVLFVALLLLTIFFPHVILRPVDRYFDFFDRHLEPKEKDNEQE